MDAFPPEIRSTDGERPTGMICPDCGGSLVVRAIADDVRDGDGLVFTCRVGHVFGLEDLLRGKEAHIERSMWSAVFAYEELVAILRNLESRDGPETDGIDGEERRRRLESAEQIAAGLRALIQRDEAIRLKRSGDD
jgi:hypothetical protein